MASYSGISLHPAGVAWAAVAGLFIAMTLGLYFYALALEDVSRIAPIIATSPVFTFVIASLVFGERATTLQIAGLLIVTFGILVISLQPTGRKIGFTRMKPFLAALASSFTAAWVFIAMDEATQHIDPISLEAVRTLCVGIIVGLFTWRTASLRSARKALANKETLFLFFTAEGALAVSFMLLFAYAVSVGPVAPVSTVTTAVAPVVVFVAATILSKWRWGFLDEKTDGRSLTLKLAGTALVVLGVLALKT